MAEFSVSEALSMTDASISKKINPYTTLTYVQAGDIGGDYVAGSEGQVKSITEYRDLEGNILLSTTTLKYTDTSFPTKPTSIEVV